jgi:hypothetical protein
MIEAVNATLPQPPDHDELVDLPHDEAEPPFDEFSDDGEGDGEGDGDGEPIRWVTVASFWSAEQAHLARLKVEADEIPVVLDNENLVSMNWLWANAVGGVRLRVPEEDASRARRILDPSSPSAPPAPSDADAGAEDHRERCPSCGCGDVRPLRFSRWAVFGSMLILGFPLPLLSRKLSCGRCNARWNRVCGFPVVPRDERTD